MSSRRVGSKRSMVVVALAIIAASFTTAGSAAAQQFGISAFDGEVTANSAGDAYTQAGGHPFAGSTAIALNTMPSGHSPTGSAPVEDVRTIDVVLPAGLIGNPAGLPTCSQREFALGGDYPACPVESQVGYTVLDAGVGILLPVAVYNLDPAPGAPATLGFSMFGVRVTGNAYVSAENEYRVGVRFENINQGLMVIATEMVLWGTPASPVHDQQRCGVLSAFVTPIACVGAPGTLNGPHSAAVPLRPFLSLPTSCSPAGEGVVTDMTATSWQSGAVASSSVESHLPPGYPLPPQDWGALQGPTGCDRLPFEVGMDVRPTSVRADGATGLEVDLSLPQDGLSDPGGLATAHLKRAEVTLPEGMSINPAAADGLAACRDDQLGLGRDTAVSCPDGSKIGSVVVDTPLLADPLGGAIYVRSQASDDPMSGEMFRLALVVENAERGIRIKLPGSVRADRRTGQLVTTFDNNPQFPFSSMRLRLKSGDRAPLALPQSCGTKMVRSELTSWAEPDVPVVRTSTFEVACPGATGFAPSFEAGTVSPTGGTFSPLVARIGRPAGQQFLSGVQVEMPQGLLAKLAGVERCPDAVAGDGTPGGCPEGSRVGTATVGAGSGDQFYLQGPAYLTGPYKGAPYGLAVHVHAKAGPFDLGMVKVRQALHVDRATAEVTVVSDPLPQIVKGVPVRLRSVDVGVDREGFTINPTSCDEKRIQTTLTSVNGTVHQTDTRFQGADCQALPFKPRLGLRLTGKRQRTTGKHPGVKAVVRQSGVGEAGIERARVVLPKSLALDPDNAQALCEHEDGIKPDLENHCPEGSIVGRARAKTPLLDRDLVGDVYFVKNVKRSKTGNLIRTLPMIVVALRGEIAINLKGVSSTTRSNRLVNTFAEVPDAPITRFNLNIKGGKTGILAVTRTRKAKINLCDKPKSHTASTRWRGHNGKQAAYRVRVKTPCGKGKAAKARQGKARRA